ncbi:hypothetical protein GCM10020366_72130 [Saccharopolyspora gregorii]|uniref:HTH tetR-type domain-containing protein n=1 Tax=Saccharopolyspora gregorii TaxID=33914 RepID=A0ABP6S455_9PSEU
MARCLGDLISVLRAPARAVRPELPAATARLLASASLSGIAGWSTHRVALGDKVAQARLCSIAAVLLAADPPADSPNSAAPAGNGVPDLAARREKLLAAAVPLFRRRGFHAVSMEEIGTAAGINASSVYRTFSGKADLLAAVYYRAADRLTSACGQAVADARTPRAARRGLVAAYVDFAFRNRDLLAVYLSEYKNLPTTGTGTSCGGRSATTCGSGRWWPRGAPGRPARAGDRAGALNMINDLAMASAQPGHPGAGQRTSRWTCCTASDRTASGATGATAWVNRESHAHCFASWFFPVLAG